MLGLLLVVASIAVFDSLNPSTIGPALYLATTRRGPRTVGAFALGVFVVSFAGGLVLALGPGQLLLSLVPRPKPTTKHLIELAAGAIVLVFNAVFVSPLLALMVLSAFARERSGPLLELAQDHLRRHGAILLAIVALAVGVALVAVGAIGLAGG